MKQSRVFFLIFFVLISSAHSLSILCEGKTNDINASENAKFEVEIKQDEKGIFKNFGPFYRATIKYFFSTGTSYTGIDLSDSVSTYLNKIVFKGSLAEKRNLTFELDQTGMVKNVVMNYDSKIINQPVQCEISGDLPARPVCPTEAEKELFLLKAIRASDLDLVQTALDCGANVNLADINGCTPLMFAIEPTCGQNTSSSYRSLYSKTPKVLDLLVSSGAYVDTLDAHKENALIKAAKMGVADVYETFIALDADFNTQDELGNTALMYAVKNGDSRVVDQILEGNPDRKIRNALGKTAFDIAGESQRKEIVDLVRIADLEIVVEGKPDGTCSLSKIEVRQGQVADLKLKATDKMFKFTSVDLGIELMADRNGFAKKTIAFDKKGKFKFSCGFHGVGKPTAGSFVIE